jgi:hypothetical protein
MTQATLSPQERLDKLTDELEASNVLSRESWQWLLVALLCYRYAPGPPLDYWLGRWGPGRRRPDTVGALRLRNQCLRQAVDAIALDRGMALYPRCERLARHVTELDRAWRRGYAHTQEPPDAWPEWKKHLFRAWRLGRKIPATARGLYEALKKTGHSFQNDNVTLGAPDIEQQEPPHESSHLVPPRPRPR